MTNTFTALIQTALVLSRDTLRANSVLGRHIWNDIAARPDNGIRVGAKNDVISVIIPKAKSAGNVTEGTFNATALAPLNRSITLSNYKEVTFGIGISELNNMIAKGYIEGELKEAIVALANAYDESIRDLWIKLPYGMDATGAITDITGAKKMLDKAKAPKEDRHAVLASDLIEKYLQLTTFVAADQSGNNRTQAEGELGRKFGLDIDSDQNLDSETTYDNSGDLVTGDNPIVNAETAAGLSSVALKQTTGGTKTLKAGDQITLAGDSEPYAVTAAASLANNTATTVYISPAIRTTIAASAAVSVKRFTGRQVSLAFHRKAMAVASAVPKGMDETNSLRPTAYITDPVSGLTMGMAYETGHLIDYVTVFALWGVGVGIPELACRIHYQPGS